MQEIWEIWKWHLGRYAEEMFKWYLENKNDKTGHMLHMGGEEEK